MRPAHAALLLLLSPVPARASCGCLPPDLWSLVAGSDLVVEARPLPGGALAAADAPVAVEVVRAHKGQAAGRLEVLLDPGWLEDCPAAADGSPLLLWILEGDRFVQEAEQRLAQAPADTRSLERLEERRRRLAGRLVVQPFFQVTCLEPARLEAVGRAVERVDDLQRSGGGSGPRREALLELSEDSRTRELAVPALAWLAHFPGEEFPPLSPTEQARLAGAFTRDPAVDGSTTGLLALLDGYQDDSFDAALLDTLEETLLRPASGPGELFALVEVLGRLLGNEDDDWESLRREVGGPSGEGFTTEQLRRGLALVRERGGRRLSASPEGER